MSDTIAQSLHDITHEILPIVRHMMNVVIHEDEDKDKLVIYVGTKSAKDDLEMLLPTNFGDRLVVEIAPKP